MAELLVRYKDWIVNYHEHDSLLENKLEEELSEEERKAAWEEYEQEKKGIMMRQQPVNPGSGMLLCCNSSVQLICVSLTFLLTC